LTSEYIIWNNALMTAEATPGGNTAQPDCPGALVLDRQQLGGMPIQRIRVSCGKDGSVRTLEVTATSPQDAAARACATCPARRRQ